MGKASRDNDHFGNNPLKPAICKDLPPHVSFRRGPALLMESCVCLYHEVGGVRFIAASFLVSAQHIVSLTLPLNDLRLLLLPDTFLSMLRTPASEVTGLQSKLTDNSRLGSGLISPSSPFSANSWSYLELGAPVSPKEIRNTEIRIEFLEKVIFF